MARGFGGETTEQEARGNEGLSVADVASGRADAATSAALGGRDVDPGGGGGDNDYTPRPGVDMSPGRMQAMYGNNPLATQLAGINQQKFNQARGITSLNPYGKDGFFSRFLGIDPKNIDYSNTMDQRTRGSIANNQYSKFMNPQNLPTLPGYNRDFPTAERGQLRSGVQKAGYETAFGPVMSQAREQSTGEMLARGAFGLLAGLPGLALGQIGTKEYGLPGQPGFEDFDPNNPRPGGGILGQFLGGLNPTQAKDALVGAFAPVAPAPTPTSIGTAPADLKGFENRFSQHPLTGETTIEPSGSSIVDGKTGFQTETLPDGSVRSVQTTGGMTKAEADEIKNNFENTKNLSAEEAAARAMERLENSSYNFFTDPQAGGTYPSAMAGEQLSGLFGDDPRAAGFRSLQDNIQSIINNEPLPDNQNMYGPGMQDQAPLTPDELNNILEPYGMELGRGPSSGGVMQLAGATGGTDVTNMTQDERGMYRVGKDSNAIQRAFEALGLRPSKRGPSAQFYSPNKSRSFFDNPVGYVLGS